MTLTIVALDEDPAAWDAALGSVSERQRDVYFTAPYLLLCQRKGDGRAYGAVFRLGDTTVVYPFLRRRFADDPTLARHGRDLSDIQTAYGYGGPLIVGPRGAEALGRFRDVFSAWCRENGVVSEFVRFHPLLDTHVGMERYVDVAMTNTTVWCRLGLPLDEQMSALAPATRRGLRKAHDAGLTAEVETSDEAHARFAELYRTTMVRRHASPSYLFGDRYFADLHDLLGPSHALLCVRNGSTIVAAAILLRSTDFVHYHLGCSDPAALHLRPNNLLLFAAGTCGWAQGATALHLGGGFREGDDLFRFKAGFSPLRAEFRVGRAVHLPDVYERAVQGHPAAARALAPDYFPAYRAPLRPS